MTNSSASDYFNANWKKYQNSMSHNTLYHREMMAAFSQFLMSHLKGPFSMIDIGCGDCSATAPVLEKTNIENYIGVDAAPDVLHLAEKNMQLVNCKKEFICDNMLNVLQTIPVTVDIVFTSYAVHHLVTDEKFSFIQEVKNKLKTNGYFVMVDGVLKPKQTRDEWLMALRDRMEETQHLSPDELVFRMQHPTNNDYPDSIQTFKEFATKQQWKSFEVVVDKGIFAFMVFTK